MYMANTCLNELEIERDALLADTTLVLVTGDELAAGDQAYRDMRAKLEAMGPVKMLALEEYRETAERHAFLDEQRKDLDFIDRKHDGDDSRNRRNFAPEIPGSLRENQRELPGHVQESSLEAATPS